MRHQLDLVGQLSPLALFFYDMSPQPVVATDYLNTSTMAVNRLFDSSTLRIPDYQRSYSWSPPKRESDRTPLRQLWDDLIDTYRRNFPRTDPNARYTTHFLGTIVLLSDDQGSAPEVIDGQQRLVTLSILLARARRFVDQQARDAIRQRLIAPMVIGGGARSRIHLNEVNTFYTDYVTLAISQEEQNAALARMEPEVRDHPVTQRLIDVSRYFDERLEEFQSQHTTPDALTLLLYTATELMLVIRMELRRPEMAYRVFETLNARGLDLTQADLIKNLLLQKTDEMRGEEDLQLAKDDWASVRVSSESISETVSAPDAIQISYQSRYGSVQSTRLFERVKAKLDGGLDPLRYSGYLKTDLSALEWLVDEGANHAGAARALAELKDPLNISRSYATLIAAYSRFGPNSDAMFNVITLTRNFCFRTYTIGSTSLDSLTSSLIEGARIIREDDDPLEALVKHFRADSPDLEFRQAFEVFAPKNVKTAFNILWHIESYLGAGEGIAVLDQSPKQHLEHIFPRNPGAEWAIDNEEEAERRNLYVQRLGNLLVLEGSINSYIRNRGFTFKHSNPENTDYLHSRLQLPRVVTDYLDDGVWSIKSIEDRQRFLADEFATQIWPLGVTD